MPAVRVDETTHRILRELAELDQETMSEVMARAVESYRRRRFLAAANASYAALKSDPEAWKEELEGRESWDVTLGDGLEG